MTSEKESLPRRYSEEEVAAFLERATELQRAGSGEGSRSAPPWAPAPWPLPFPPSW